MIVRNINFQVFQYIFQTLFAKCNDISHYEQKENEFYRIVVLVNRVHGDSVNKRVARGEMTRNIYSHLLGSVSL